MTTAATTATDMTTAATTATTTNNNNNNNCYYFMLPPFLFLILLRHPQHILFSLFHTPWLTLVTMQSGTQSRTQSCECDFSLSYVLNLLSLVDVHGLDM
jgi:hypothetical protein